MRVKKEKRRFWHQGIFALLGLISAVMMCIVAIFGAPFHVVFLFLIAGAASLSIYSRQSGKAKKGTRIGLLVILLIIGAMGTGVWFATAPIREAKERADYQASIKTVQGAIKSYGYYRTWFARWFDYVQDYSEVEIIKEDGQIVILLLNKKLQSLEW